MFPSSFDALSSPSSFSRRLTWPESVHSRTTRKLNRSLEPSSTAEAELVPALKRSSQVVETVLGDLGEFENEVSVLGRSVSKPRDSVPHFARSRRGRGRRLLTADDGRTTRDRSFPRLFQSSKVSLASRVALKE